VTLDGAKLNALAGGSSKQDIKRGFALVERSGATRYFIAFTGPQCGVWTRELQEAIRAASRKLDEARSNIETGVEDSDRPERNELSATYSESNQGRNVPEVEGGTPRKRIGIGIRLAATKNRIGSALETARLKGLEVSERRRLNNPDSMDTDDGTYEAYGDNRSEREPPDGQAEFGGDQDFGWQADCIDSMESILNDESIDVDARGYNGADLTKHADSIIPRHTEESSKILVERKESMPIGELSESMIDQISESDAVGVGAVVPVEESIHDFERGGGDQSVFDANDTSGPRRRLQFGAKLSGVRQATKTRIGSALQTARQKGVAVAGRRRMDIEESVHEFSQHGTDSSEDQMRRTDGSDSLTDDEQVCIPGAARNSTEDGNLATADSADDTENSTGQNVRPRFGGKFAGVRQATKSRIGSAIQNVRLKGKEVSERRRLDSEDMGDKVQGLQRTKLDGLLSGTSAATAIDSGSVYDNAPKAGLSWSCNTCTFVNNSENHPNTLQSCEMCGEARPKEDQFQSNVASIEFGNSAPEGQNSTKAKEVAHDLPTETATIQADFIKNVETSHAGNTNDAEQTDTGPRRGMFGGMRNVLANKTERQPPALQATDNRKAGRFAFRKRNDEMDSLVDGGGPVKFKNLRAGESFLPDSIPEEAKFREPQILRRLVGDWAVLVESGRKEYGSGTLFWKKLSNVQPQSAQEEIESRRHQCEFRICVIPVVPGPEDTPIQTECNIADIFELHTRVSEAVAMVLPQVASETTENGRPDDRTDLGGMTQSMSYRLGLSSLDNVLLTGKILGGLMDFDESSEIFKKMHDYQGKL
jgi:ribosomal protein L13E